MASHEAYSRTFRFLGLDEMRFRLRRIRDQAPQIAGQALFEEATIIFNETQKVVPVRTGVLKGSGYVTPPRFTPNEVYVELGYGGAAASYAPIVHERIYRSTAEGFTAVRHKAPTKAKFLEEPMLEAEAQLANRLGRRVGAILFHKGLV